MTKVSRQYIENENLKEAKIAVVKSGGDAVTVEVSYNEYAPISGFKMKHMMLSILALVFCLLGIAFFFGAFTGNIVFVFLCVGSFYMMFFCGKRATAPFKAAMIVRFPCDESKVEILRNGKIEERVEYSHLRAIGVEKDPRLEEVLVKYHDRPKSQGLAKQLQKLEVTKAVVLHVGKFEVTERIIPVGSFYLTKGDASDLALQARAALETGYQFVQALQESAGMDLEQVQEAAQEEKPIVERRRRKKIE